MSSPFDQVIDRRSLPNLNKWNWYPADVLPLWLADMDFRAPPPVLQAIRRALDHGVLGYERASRSLYELIAARLERLFTWSVSPEIILAIPGVNIGCQVAAAVACPLGGGVVIQPPVFYQFIDFPAMLGFTRQDAPLRRMDLENIIRYDLDLQVLEGSIHAQDVETGLFLLCNPHNPVGKVFSPAELERIAQLCIQNDILICSDDIHNELVIHDARYTPLAALSPQVAAQTITLLGPGKTFNIPGLFCAFAIIPDPGLRQRYAAELERRLLEVNSLGLAAARPAYSGECDEWLAELRGYLWTNCQIMLDFIRSELPRVAFTVPDATYLAWLDFNAYLQSGEISGSPFSFLLEKAKVALYDGAAFGPGGEGFVRLNFACPRAVLLEALERIAKALSI